MAQKMLLCFGNISFKKLAPSFKQQLLGQTPYFGLLLPDADAFKSIRNFMRKSCSALAPKMLMKETPGGRNWQLISPHY
jgi:hypothetical protein